MAMFASTSVYVHKFVFNVHRSRHEVEGRSEFRRLPAYGLCMPKHTISHPYVLMFPMLMRMGLELAAHVDPFNYFVV